MSIKQQGATDAVTGTCYELMLAGVGPNSACLKCLEIGFLLQPLQARVPSILAKRARDRGCTESFSDSSLDAFRSGLAFTMTPWMISLIFSTP